MNDIPEMLALSVRQPWAWAIFHAGKDVENRMWVPSRSPGRFMIHAAKTVAKLEELLDAEVIKEISGRVVPDDLPRGVLLGTVELVECVDKSSSPWFNGPFGFVLKNPVLFGTPIPCRGRLGFFKPEF